MRKHFPFPPFAKNATDAPILLVMPAQSKAWATRLIEFTAFVSLLLVLIKIIMTEAQHLFR